MNAPAKSLVAKYLEQLAEIISPEGIYAYRGQANANWEVESAAYRRLKKGKSEKEIRAITQQYFIDYHRQEILEPARMNGYGIKNGRKLSDLELLAELQHNGAATCLIDFTRDFFIALWFACQSCKDKDGNEQDGKVFILNINDPGTFQSIEQTDMNHKGGIKAILNFHTRQRDADSAGMASLEQASYWHWSPHGINQRILRQNSLFIFGKPSIDANFMQEITIPQTDKSAILPELGLLGTTRESLFKDMPGFASIHGHEETVALLLPQDNFRAGNAAMQEGKFEKAIELYSKVIKSNPRHAEAYHQRAGAQFYLGCYKATLKDLNRAIHRDSEKARWYHNRGVTKYHLGRFKSAIKDLRHAKKLAEQADDKEWIRKIEKLLSRIGSPDDA